MFCVSLFCLLDIHLDTWKALKEVCGSGLVRIRDCSGLFVKQREPKRSWISTRSKLTRAWAGGCSALLDAYIVILTSFLKFVFFYSILKSWIFGKSCSCNLDFKETGSKVWILRKTTKSISLVENVHFAPLPSRPFSCHTTISMLNHYHSYNYYCCSSWARRERRKLSKKGRTIWRTSARTYRLPNESR